MTTLKVKSSITLVGCLPEVDEPLPKFVKYMGFISKSTQEGQNKINNFLAESHFLILPSIADCTPMVFSEANSFGVPCLSTNVGGITTVIKDDLNGKTFSKSASIVEYCRYIYDLFEDYSRYKDLALSSFNEYQTRLNWSVAGQAVKKLLMEVI